MQEWKGKGYNNVCGCVADLSNNKDLLKFVKFVKQKSKRIDCLVNNVGINIRKPTVDITEEDYDRVMNTNLRSCYFVTQLLQPLLENGTNGASGM